MREALRSAEVAPDQVGYLNAHGTSTQLNDKYETAAIKRVFSGKAPLVSSTKGATGHCLGGAGGIEAVLTVASLSSGVLPPTINYETKDPDCDLDYIPNEPREIRVDYAMSNSFGFGGTNASLLLKSI